MNLPVGKRKIAYLAVFIMVMGGTGAYFSIAAASGGHNSFDSSPPIASFIPSQTTVKVGGGTGGYHYTFFGNTTWCAWGDTANTTFDVGQTNAFSFGGNYNGSTDYGPSSGVCFYITLPGAPNSVELGTPYAFAATISASPGELVSYTFTQSGTYLWNIEAGVESSLQYAITVNPAPSVSVSSSANPLEMPNPPAVTFTASASGGDSPYTYQWDINGTAVSGATSSTFTHTFTGAASYSITVNVTDSLGYEITSTAFTETIYPQLKLSMTSSANPADIGKVTYTFTASGGSGTYSDYCLYVNGSKEGTFTSSTVSYTFSGAATYSVYGIVLDSADYTAQSSTIDQVISTKLAASVSTNTSKTETEIGFGIEFESTVAGGVPPYTYSWSVSDNGQTPLTGTGSDINYTNPNEAGTLSAKLTVKDSQTDTVTLYENVTVLPDLRLVNATFSNNVRWVVSEPQTIYGNLTGGLGPYTVVIDLISSPYTLSDITTSNFSWKFTPPSAGPSETANIEIYDSLDYPAPGSGYQVNDRIYSITEPQTVPFVSIAASPQKGIAPLTVDFSGFIETEMSGPVQSSYNWTFSNGVNTLTQNPVETFAAGNYTATLTADYAGEINSALVSITALPVAATFSYSPHTGGTVLTDYNFTAQIAWWVTTYNITWTFPGGTQHYGNSTHYKFSSYSPTQNVSAVISYTNGSYTSYLNVRMSPAPITADFSVPEYIPVQTLISLNATVNDPDSTQITYKWTFNGQNYTGPQQLFFLGNPQAYNITLNVTDQYGMTYSITKTVTAVIPSNDGNITISIITKTSGPDTTYDIQIYSKDGISVVEALLGSQTLSPTFLNNTDGYWYELTLNQGSYYAGSYSLEFVVFDKAAQSNSKTVTFFVSQTYGKTSGGFSLATFFGSAETEIITLIGIAATVGTAIVYSRDKKDRDTQYINLNGAVVKAKRTPGSYNKFKKRNGGN